MTHPRDTLKTLGHETQQQLLLDLIAKERLPQTLLFAGPKGVGKATLAYQLACYLFTGGASADALFGPQGLDIDPEAAPVKRVRAGSHGDLLIIEPELSGQNQTPIIKVDAVRKVSEFFSKTASEGNWRIVIIDGAESLNLNAANALLKAVEEPPLNAVMILITHQFGRLLPTLKSRCRQVHFRGLSIDPFNTIMTRHELHDSSMLDSLHALTGGSPGQALAFAEQDALTMYHDILACFTDYPKPSSEAIQRMLQRVDKMAKQGGWQQWAAMWHLFLTRLIQSHQSSLNQNLSSDEKSIFTSIPISESWLAILQESETLIRRAESLHLERKQVIQSLIQLSFGSLKKAA